MASVAERLNAFHRLLTEWNAFKGLVSRQDIDDLWHRHVEDSLQAVPLIPSHVDRAIDIGSGAGFPGLIVAVAARIHVDLFESNKQKCAFLREAYGKVYRNGGFAHAAFRVEHDPTDSLHEFSPVTKSAA